MDHPATRAAKIEKVKEIFEELPAHVTSDPVVFGEQSLDEKLIASDYNKEMKTFFIIEGLLMYIPPAAVEGLLAFIIKASGPESSFVADSFDTTVVEGASPLKEAIVLRQFVEKEGSALKFGIQAGQGEAFFRKRGFRQVYCVSATACKDKFFTNDSCNRTVSPMFNFVHAMK